MSLLTKSEEPAVKLTSGQRLARGLKEAALAPIDVSRGTAGLSFGLAKSATSAAGRLLRRGKAVSSEVQDAVADVVDTLPEVVSDARKRKLPRALTGLAVVGLLGAGAVAFSVLRRSGQPEPSPLAPSVDPQPQP
ncbi:cell wall synthesis protein CwsA [Mycobacteroides abscessus subsp. massiliense]|uniref:cell wall synthesis protein CwsA n=1 Tax=Mycobacteroides abscessus TaxID=36809 RepID=UPI00266BFBA7|nr:cell wall synthesis protein CwsA [Mycobacteroides abscessus]MDO3301174.1 cell wall synthesis protein CwsA [Mycobacteroides abscessus subsp. massiliense]